nr:MAG TPA: hypothetical protein [Caudoviricetes sp.]
MLKNKTIIHIFKYIFYMWELCLLKHYIHHFL